MISNKTVLIYDDGGLYTYLASFLGRYFGKVQYHHPISEQFPRSPQAQIGKGLPEVEWVDSFWKHLDKADVLFFPDVYSYDLQEVLKSKGYAVCGCGKAAKMELDKAYFLERVHKAGLPVPSTYRAEGLDDLWEYVKDKDGLYMKNAEKYRGDFETKKHRNRHATELFLNQKRQQLGAERSKEIEILIQEPIEAACEIGVDGFSLDGVMPENSCLGYEIKDEGIVEKVFKTLPKIILDVNDKLEKDYKGMQGPYSLEMRIADNGRAYPIDATCRAGSPPSGVLTEMYGEAYASAVWSLAHGEMPVIEPEHEWGAEVMLASGWHRDNELHVGMTKEIEPFVRLKNSVKKGGQYYCIPNDPSGGDGIFGSIVAVGDSREEVTEMVMEMIKELDVDTLDYKENLFDEAEEQCKAGVKFGIEM